MLPPRRAQTLTTLYQAPIALGCEERRLPSPFTLSMPFIPTTFTRSRQTLHLPRQTIHDPSGDSPLPSDFAGLWSVAFESYRLSLKGDLRDHSTSLIRDMEKCTTYEEILGVLRNTSERLNENRRGSSKARALRETMTPIVRGLSVISTLR